MGRGSTACTRLEAGAEGAQAGAAGAGERGAGGAARRGAAAAAGAGGVQRHRRRVRQQHVQRLLMGVTSWAAFGMHTRAAFAHACMRTCASSDSRLCCMLQRPQKEPFYLGSEITFHIQAPAPQLTERCKSDEWTF